jgi:orotidine-5'-phosphate decarboxylase
MVFHLPFQTRIEQTAKNKESNIVLALDFPFEKPIDRSKLLSKANGILEAVHPYVCAVKINHHLVLPLGLFDGIQGLVEKIHGLGMMAIMDCKVNDIGSTNQVIAEYYYAAGFDALIANPFIGWAEGLQPIFDIARKLQRGVILLVYMSHKGACEGYGQTIIDAETNEKVPQYISFAKRVLKWSADGVVVGATYPNKIREVYAILGKSVPIFSPGVGVQGGEIKAALEAGARYLVVGRAIVQSENPAKTAREIRDLARQAKTP